MIFLDRPITGQCRRKSVPILMWDYVSGKRNEQYIKYEYFEFGPLELPRVRQGFLARPCEPPSPAESADSLADCNFRFARYPGAVAGAN
jgi:hypothetical protein